MLVIPGNTRNEIEASPTSNGPRSCLVPEAPPDFINIQNSPRAVQGFVSGQLSSSRATISSSLYVPGDHIRQPTECGGTLTFPSRKIQKCHDGLGQMAHSVWGLRFPLMIAYYQHIFLAMVSYGAAAWTDLLNSRHSDSSDTATTCAPQAHQGLHHFLHRGALQAFAGVFSWTSTFNLGGSSISIAAKAFTVLVLST